VVFSCISFSLNLVSSFLGDELVLLIQVYDGRYFNYCSREICFSSPGGVFIPGNSKKNEGGGICGTVLVPPT